MRAGFAYWLKRWDKIYDKIVASLSSDPQGKVGNSIASDWRDLIEQHLCVPPKELAVGVMLWQEIGRQPKPNKHKTGFLIGSRPNYRRESRYLCANESETLSPKCL